MSVIKIIEIIGMSDKGWEDAVRNGVKVASRTIDDITGVEVTKTTAKVVGDQLTEYRATLKIAFKVKER